MSVVDKVTAMLSPKYGDRTTKLVAEIMRLDPYQDRRASELIARWLVSGEVQSPNEHSDDIAEYKRLRAVLKGSRFGSDGDGAAAKKELMEFDLLSCSPASLGQWLLAARRLIDESEYDDSNLHMVAEHVDGNDVYRMYRIAAKKDLTAPILKRTSYCIFRSYFGGYGGPPYYIIFRSRGDAPPEQFAAIVPGIMRSDPANAFRDSMNTNRLPAEQMARIAPLIEAFVEDYKIAKTVSVKKELRVETIPSSICSFVRSATSQITNQQCEYIIDYINAGGVLPHATAIKTINALRKRNVLSDELASKLAWMLDSIPANLPVQVIRQAVISRHAKLKLTYRKEDLKPYGLTKKTVVEDDSLAYAIFNGYSMHQLFYNDSILDYVLDRSERQVTQELRQAASGHHVVGKAVLMAILSLRGEPIDDATLAEVAGNPDAAILYAHLTRRRFQQGERAIARNGRYSYHYATKVLFAPFEVGEASIFASDDCTKYLQTFPWRAQPISVANMITSVRKDRAFGSASDVGKYLLEHNKLQDLSPKMFWFIVDAVLDTANRSTNNLMLGIKMISRATQKFMSYAATHQVLSQSNFCDLAACADVYIDYDTVLKLAMRPWKSTRADTRQCIIQCLRERSVCDELTISMMRNYEICLTKVFDKGQAEMRDLFLGLCKKYHDIGVNISESGTTLLEGVPDDDLPRCLIASVCAVKAKPEVVRRIAELKMKEGLKVHSRLLNPIDSYPWSVIAYPEAPLDGLTYNQERVDMVRSLPTRVVEIAYAFANMTFSNVTHSLIFAEACGLDAAIKDLARLSLAPLDDDGLFVALRIIKEHFGEDLVIAKAASTPGNSVDRILLRVVDKERLCEVAAADPLNHDLAKLCKRTGIVDKVVGMVSNRFGSSTAEAFCQLLIPNK